MRLTSGALCVHILLIVGSVCALSSNSLNNLIRNVLYVSLFKD